MTEIGRITTCAMPHGSRISAEPRTGGISRCRCWTPRPLRARSDCAPCGRYAFISVEGIAAEPGTVEVVDLATLKTVARVGVASQVDGIDLEDGIARRATSGESIRLTRNWIWQRRTCDFCAQVEIAARNLRLFVRPVKTTA